jgi:hypothetical protein
VLLKKNKIFISTPTLKKPLFNYASFCRVLSIYEFSRIIDNVLYNRHTTAALSSKDRNCLVAKELLKMFMNQIPSLERLAYYPKYSSYNPSNISFINFPGARDCLAALSELCCSTNVHSEFFHNLSEICHNLQSLTKLTLQTS